MKKENLNIFHQMKEARKKLNLYRRLQINAKRNGKDKMIIEEYAQKALFWYKEEKRLQKELYKLLDCD